MAIGLQLGWSSAAFAQFGMGQGGGGGIQMDAQGVLRSIPSKGPAAMVEPDLAAAMAASSASRRVSLRGIDRQLREHKPGEPLPVELEHLAGLYRLDFLLVDPDRKDVVLIGPAEGWQISADGRAIGKTSRRPALNLVDLAAALRCVLRGPGYVECSIDPSPDGVKRIQRYQMPPFEGRVDLRAIEREVRDAFGLQSVRTAGVPKGSRFALAMIDADYRMKRFAIGVERFPGLVSHLDATAAATAEGNAQQGLARWWFTPWYEGIRADSAGRIFQFLGQGLKLENERVLFDEAGRRRGAAAASPDWDRFAQSFTKLLPKMETKVAALADLHNLFDLLLAAGLIQREGAGEWFADSPLLDDERLPIDVATPPRQAEPVAAVKRTTLREDGARRYWIAYSFGGVSMRPADVLKANPPKADSPKPVEGPSEAPRGEKPFPAAEDNNPTSEPKTEAKSWWSDDSAPSAK